MKGRKVGIHPARAALLAELQSPLFVNASALVVNTGATAALGMVYWVIAARLYRPESIGLAAAMISAMTFLASIAELNLAMVLTRFIPTAGREVRRLIVGSYAVTVLLAVLLTTAFVLQAHRLVPSLSILSTNAVWGLWFVIASTAWCIFVTQDGVLTGLRRTLWVPVENIAYGTVKIGLLLALASFAHGGIFVSWTAPVLILVIPVNWLIFRRFLPAHEHTTPPGALPALRSLARFVALDYVGTVFWFVTTTLLPLLVTHMFGARENAYFYQSWTIAYMLHLISSNTMSSLTVEAALRPLELAAFSRRMLKRTLQVVCPVALMILVGAPLVLRVFGEEYAREGTSVLRLLTLASIPYVFISLANAIARVRNAIGEVVATRVGISVLVLGYSFTFARDQGIEGIAIGWLAAQCVTAVILLYRYRWLFTGN